MPIDKYTQNWREACSAAQANGLKIIEHGWEQHVIINEEQGLVYRYPRHEAAAAKLADEVAVLHDVNRQQWQIQLPVIIEHTETYTSYKYIRGEVLTSELVDKLELPDFEQIGEKLGAFIARFHKLDFSVVEQKKTKQSTGLIEYYAERINNAAASTYHPKAKAALNALSSAENHTAEVVVHGDLYGPNIVIDPASKKLRGVIDLSEMEIGDPHHEFRKIFMSYPHSLSSAVNSYNRHGGQKLNPDRIILWAYTNEWANAVHFADTPDNVTYQRAISHLAMWQQL